MSDYYENRSFINNSIDASTRVDRCPITIDFDGDGLLDIVASSENGPDIRWFKQGENGGLTDNSNTKVINNFSDIQTISGIEIYGSSNYPNPFSDQTSLSIELSAASKVQLEIFTVAGKRVYQDIYELAKGTNNIALAGNLFPKSGIYFYRIHTKNQMIRGKMIKL